MTTWKHRLEDVDLSNKRARCINCGWVDIKLVAPNGHPRCNVIIKEERRKWRMAHTARKYPGKPKSCEVCGNNSRRICYDHNHKTDKFRGWLCINCNVALGSAKDNREILLKLVTYLDKHTELPRL